MIDPTILGLAGGIAILGGYNLYRVVKVHLAKKHDPVLCELDEQASEVHKKMIEAYKNGAVEEELLPYCQELIRLSLRRAFRSVYLEDCT